MPGRRMTAPGCRINARRSLRSTAVALVATASMCALLASFAAAAGTPGVTVSTAPLQPDSGSLAIRCGRLIDGVSPAVQRDITLIVRNGRIDSLQAAAPAPADRHAHAPDRRLA